MIAPYTSFYLFSFSGGQSVNISTNASGSFSHVIDFVKVDDTAYSWSVVATGNGSLNVTTPSQGTYMLRLRTLWKGSGLNS